MVTIGQPSKFELILDCLSVVCSMLFKGLVTWFASCEEESYPIPFTGLVKIAEFTFMDG